MYLPQLLNDSHQTSPGGPDQPHLPRRSKTTTHHATMFPKLPLALSITLAVSYLSTSVMTASDTSRNLFPVSKVAFLKVLSREQESAPRVEPQREPLVRIQIRLDTDKLMPPFRLSAVACDFIEPKVDLEFPNIGDSGGFTSRIPVK